MKLAAKGCARPMILTRGTLQSAAAQIREAEMLLGSIVRELVDAGVWSGSDADRFERDWNDRVRGPLHGAAATLDGVSYITFV